MKRNLNTTTKRILMFVVPALLLLCLGLLFLMQGGGRTSSDAGGMRLYLYVKSYYYNSYIPDGTITFREGNYVSARGNNTTGSVGEIWVYGGGATGNVSSKFEYSGYCDTTNTSNTGSRAKGYLYSKVWHGIDSYTYHFFIRVSPAAGFKLSGLYYYCEGVPDYKDTISGNYYYNDWYSSSTYCGVDISGRTPTFGITNDYYLAYYAVFSPKTYSIAYNANGGCFADGSTAKYANTLFYEDYNIISQTPTKTGYTFAGWYTNEIGGYKVDSDTGFTSVHNTTLYARWTPNNYTINLDKNGGTGGTDSVTATYDSTYPNIKIPTREGYSFLGYFTSKNGGSRIYDASGKGWGAYNLAQNMQLYAHWSANTYAIKVNPVGGKVVTWNGWTENAGTVGKNITFDTTYGALPVLEKTGYTFVRYYHANTGETLTSESLMNTAGDHSIVAEWLEHRYTIKFDANGGMGTMSDMTNLYYSQSVELSENLFKKTNCLFKGWATEKGGEIVFDEKDIVSSLTSENGGTVTLYAIWDETWQSAGVKPSGDGTAANPYLIASKENLAWMAGQDNLTGVFKQTANIDLWGMSWMPIGSDNYFLGDYDGNGYVITNIITSNGMQGDGNYSNSCVGLFGKVSQGEIKNVTILSGDIFGLSYVGGIVGYANEAKITACQVYATIHANKFAGSVVGFAENGTEISGCYSTSSMLDGQSNVGGIVGFLNYSSITACGFEGSLSFGNLIVGYGNASTARDCFANILTEHSFASGSFDIADCLYISAEHKKYYAGEFENWVISTMKLPLPGGLYWLAGAGSADANLQKIQELGYTLV